MAKYTIYEVTDDTNDWYYIGCTAARLNKRLGQHKSGGSAGSLRLNYPGIDRDKMKIRELKTIETDDISEAHALEEQITWDYYNKYGGDKVLNTRYGDNNDVPRPDPNNPKIQQLHIPIDADDVLVYYDEDGKKHMSEKTCERMSKSMKKALEGVDRSGPNHPCYGKKLSPERVEFLRNRPISDETRAKESAAAKKRVGPKNPMYGKHLSPETRAKISAKLSGENSPWWGRKHTEETKAKMSAYAKTRVKSEEERRKLSEHHADVSGEKNPMYGKRGEEAPWWGRKHTPEEIEKMRRGRRKFEMRKKIQQGHNLKIHLCD